MSHSSKGAPPSPKLIESAMKAVKVEMVQRAKEEEAHEEAAIEATEKEVEAAEA